MENPYLPWKAVVEGVREETWDTRTITLLPMEEERRRSFSFTPGQFIMVSIPGVGEAAFTISSSPRTSPTIQITLRKVGNVTGAIFNLRERDVVGLRGPYGRGWPMELAKGRDLLIIAGGCGCGPFRPVILEVAENRASYGSLEFLYGARTPSDIIFKEDHPSWGRIPDTTLLLTVDSVPEGQEWAYHVGVVTSLFGKMGTTPRDSLALICGPEIMMRFAVKGLLARGFQEDQICLSMERRMRCGIARCGHCQLGSKYVCKDGPVFSYREIKDLPDHML